MKFSTENQRQLAKMVLKATAVYEEGVTASDIVDKARREEIYKRPGSASSALKEMVSDNDFPIERRGDRIVRTDVDGDDL